MPCLPSVFAVDRNTSTLPVQHVHIVQTARYSTASSSSHLTSGISPQADRATDGESGPNYSRVGPAYDTVDTQRQRNQIPTNVSERYEFAQVHVETGRADDMRPDEEEHDNYSHLHR